jgi:hypothetical protein
MYPSTREDDRSIREPTILESLDDLGRRLMQRVRQAEL